MRHVTETHNLKEKKNPKIPTVQIHRLNIGLNHPLTKFKNNLVKQSLIFSLRGEEDTLIVYISAYKSS